MRLFLAISLALVGLVVLWTGCSKDDNPAGPTTTSVLWPLKIGNSWTIAGTSLDSNGVTIGKDTTRFTITRDTTIGGEKWYFIDSYEMLTNRSDGLWYRVKDTAFVPFLFVKHPANVGDTWKSISGLRGTRISSGTLLTVPAGTFTAVVSSYADTATGRLQFTWYFAPNVGWVRSDNYGYAQSGRQYVSWRRELASVTLPKQGQPAEPSRGRLFEPPR
jgi:hypothetical protein